MLTLTTEQAEELKARLALLWEIAERSGDRALEAAAFDCWQLLIDAESAGGIAPAEGQMPLFAADGGWL